MTAARRCRKRLTNLMLGCIFLKFTDQQFQLFDPFRGLAITSPLEQSEFGPEFLDVQSLGVNLMIAGRNFRLQPGSKSPQRLKIGRQFGSGK